MPVNPEGVPLTKRLAIKRDEMLEKVSSNGASSSIPDRLTACHAITTVN